MSNPISKNNKTQELFSYVNNFDNDINEMIKISDQIKEWSNRGIRVDQCIEPLNNQIEEWKNKMKSLILELKNNIEELKNVDDRIKDNSSNINISLSENNTNEYIKEDWNVLLLAYDNLYNNLVNDVNILNNVKADIQKYEKLGVELGNAIDKIDGQKENICNAANKSSNNIENIVSSIKEECGKVIIGDEESNEETNSDGLTIKSQHIEEYSGAKKEVDFDHSVIQNNESKFELQVKFITNNPGGHPVILGGGEGGNRFYFGWQTNNRGEFMVGLGATNVYTKNKYNNLTCKETTVKYIQYGDKTGRFIINDVEEDIITIPEYTYTSTGTFYYNGHYNGYPSHNGTTFEFTLLG